MKKILYSVLTVLALVGTTSCSDFLDDQKPQGVLDSDMVKEPSNVDNLVISAYAVFTTADSFPKTKSEHSWSATKEPSDLGRKRRHLLSNIERNIS